MKVAFFGTPRLAQIVLEKLIDSPYKPSLVVTALDAKAGRGQKLAPCPVKQTALANKIKVAEKLPDFDIAILVAYGKIIPKNILSIPKYGFINVHPSLLPKYRGPSPIQSAILAGEEKTGVTIIKLDEQVDHGPILASKKITISPNDTHASLIEFLGKIGANLLLQTLPAYISGKIKPKPQDHTQATFTKHISKQDGYIDINDPPDPQTFDRMTRAYHPWPNVWTQIRIKDKGLRINFLPEGKIQPEGKNPMTIKEFLNGYPQAKDLINALFENRQ